MCASCDFLFIIFIKEFMPIFGVLTMARISEVSIVICGMFSVDKNHR